MSKWWEKTLNDATPGARLFSLWGSPEKSISPLLGASRCIRKAKWGREEWVSIYSLCSSPFTVKVCFNSHLFYIILCLSSYHLYTNITRIHTQKNAHTFTYLNKIEARNKNKISNLIGWLQKTTSCGIL